MNLDNTRKIYKDKEATLITLDDGNYYLLDEITGKVHELNLTAALIWFLIENVISIHELWIRYIDTLNDCCIETSNLNDKNISFNECINHLTNEGFLKDIST